MCRRTPCGLHPPTLHFRKVPEIKASDDWCPLHVCQASLPTATPSLHTSSALSPTPIGTLLPLYATARPCHRILCISAHSSISAVNCAIRGSRWTLLPSDFLMASGCSCVGAAQYYLNEECRHVRAHIGLLRARTSNGRRAYRFLGRCRWTSVSEETPVVFETSSLIALNLKS
jgi:hypothetical protein